MRQVGADAFNGEVSGYDAARAMLNIVAEMKEIPELPSENPGDDKTTLERVDAPDEGGVLTYLTGEGEPYRGFPFFEMVEKIDTMKKMVRGALSSMFHSMKKRPKVLLLGIVFVPWLIEDLAKATLYALYRIVLRFKIKPKYYSQPMRELFRAFSVRGNSTDEEFEFTSQVRDLLCMVMEMDNAYRFRFQDVIVHLDKVALRKNPGKEVSRLLSILQSREVGQDVKDTWTLLKTFLPPVLMVNGTMRKLIVNVLCELNMDEVKLSVEDKWYACARKDYICDFRTNPTEEDKVLIARVEANNKRKQAVIAVRKESTEAHEALFARHMQELNVQPDTDAVVQAEMASYQQFLNKEAAEKYEQKRTEVLERNLSPEQKALREKPRLEIAEMDRVYTEKLSAVENQYVSN